jgi:hypothetical protein
MVIMMTNCGLYAAPAFSRSVYGQAELFTSIMNVTYLFRPDSERIFVVVDYHQWRDTSAATAGFHPEKVKHIFTRGATEIEEKLYSQSWRMLSFSYRSWSVLEKDEIEFAELDQATIQHVKRLLSAAGCKVDQVALAL